MPKSPRYAEHKEPKRLSLTPTAVKELESIALKMGIKSISEVVERMARSPSLGASTLEHYLGESSTN